MSKLAIRLLTLAAYATALAVVPTVTPAKAETSSSKHFKKHKRQTRHGFSHPRSAVACCQGPRSGRPGLPRHGPKFRLSGVASSIR